MLLLAAQETGLLSALEEALPTGEQTSLRLAHATTKTRRQALLTLLFLPAVGLRRPYDLRGYSGDALAILTTRQRAYGYRHTERFLAELARWTSSLWKLGCAEHAQSVPGRVGTPRADRGNHPAHRSIHGTRVVPI